MPSAVPRTAFEQTGVYGKSTAAHAEHAADGIIETARLLRGSIHDGQAYAVHDVEHGLAVVALKFVPVEVDNEVGRDVADAARDYYGAVGIVGNLYVGVSVFDSREKFVGVRNFHLIGHDEIEIAAVTARRAELFRIPREREREREHGRGREKEQYTCQCVFQLHTLPPSASGDSDACTNRTFISV